jgi:hypothetical protein
MKRTMKMMKAAALKIPRDLCKVRYDSEVIALYVRTALYCMQSIKIELSELRRHSSSLNCLYLVIKMPRRHVQKVPAVQVEDLVSAPTRSWCAIHTFLTSLQ